MIDMTFGHRHWVSLTRPAIRAAGTPRGRAGYTFLQRYWASLTRYRLPELQPHTLDGRTLGMHELPPEDREHLEQLLDKYRRRRRHR